MPHPDQTRQVLDYRGIVIAWWNYQTPEHAAWWIKGDSPPWRWRHWRAALYAPFVIPPREYTGARIHGPTAPRAAGDVPGSKTMVGVIDWRNADAADYYVNQVSPSRRAMHRATGRHAPLSMLR